MFDDTSLQIEGNLIGVAADGTSPLGNGSDGVRLAYTAPVYIAQSVTVGGLDPADGNVIAFNQDDGIDDKSSDDGSAAGGRNIYLSNSIYSNGLLGISDTDVTDNSLPGQAFNTSSHQIINDSGADDGVSSPQNYPVLNSALSSGGQTTISGHLDSQPDDTDTLQFFSNPTVTPSGYGQGKTYLGSITVQTDDSGHVDFTAILDVSVANGQLVTATATSADLNTSEYSLRIVVGDVLGDTYIVNTTDDTDDGAYNPAHVTLRDAILAADVHPGLDTIQFAIGSGVQTIAPLTALPVITDPVIIDGTSQPGFAGTPLIQIVGTQAEQSNRSASPLLVTGLLLDTNNSTIKGLDINSFYQPEEPDDPTNTNGNGFGIVIRGNDNVLEGCFIGTDVTGTVALRNLYGVDVRGDGNRIGGTTAAERNIISGNSVFGMEVVGFGPSLGTPTGVPNLIEGNFIGTDVTGAKPLANGFAYVAQEFFGLRVNGANIVGGPAPGASNVISGNGGYGIVGNEAQGSVIQGNFIGTDVTGTKMLGNSGPGIGIYDDDAGSPGVTIGGTQPGAGNVISNNYIGIEDGGFLDVIQGNLIGTDVTGTLDFGNATAGVIAGGGHNLIGGPQPGAGNVISGNFGYGIAVGEWTSPSASNIIIQGNRIGTQADGVSPLGNGTDGISVYSSSTTSLFPPGENVIGGADPSDGNIIAFNGRDGVELAQFDVFHLLPVNHGSSLQLDLLKRRAGHRPGGQRRHAE